MKLPIGNCQLPIEETAVLAQIGNWQSEVFR